jgi:lysine 2,3-aminomutase
MKKDAFFTEDEDPLGRFGSDYAAGACTESDVRYANVSDEMTSNQKQSLSKSGMSKSLFANSKTHAFRKKYYPGVKQSQWNDWHWQMKNRITGLSALERIIHLSDAEKNALSSSAKSLPLSITPYYASLIDRENSLQPIRRTIVPVQDEHLLGAGELADPLGEDGHSPVPGLIHRYPDRVLFLVTNTCSTYCRYCTRSRIVGSRAESPQWEKAIDYIRQNKQIRDVIISGGDPLMLSDEQLEWLLIQLKPISHLEMIRIGTKAPVVLPQRVTPALVRMLKRYHPLYVSIHFTHPDELTPETMLACNRLADAGIPLGSQTVLLKGINDEAQTLKRLFHGLLKIRVRPYYLYQCDPIQGSAHFRTPVEKGIEMIRSLRGFTSGYAIPAYVIDAPGGGGKIPLLPDYVVRQENDSLVLRNYRNQEFRYPLTANQDPANEIRSPEFLMPVAETNGCQVHMGLSDHGT